LNLFGGDNEEQKTTTTTMMMTMNATMPTGEDHQQEQATTFSCLNQTQRQSGTCSHYCPLPY